jgi:hypothetical protein
VESVGSAGSGIDWLPPSLNSQGEPSTPREGEALRRGVGWRAESVDRPAALSARGEGAGGMVVRLAPSQPERARGREVLTPRGIAANWTGYSSELGRGIAANWDGKIKNLRTISENASGYISKLPGNQERLENPHESVKCVHYEGQRDIKAKYDLF